MTKNLERSLIQQQAVQVLEQYHINKLPIDPRVIADRAKIQVNPIKDREEGVSGMLVRLGEDYFIYYATYLDNPGFENFSIAHELGHYFLEDHPDQIFQCGDTHKSNANFTSDNEIERQADTFAAGLLMPENLFRDRIPEHQKGLTCIEEMAKLCNTSLTATAIRYAELTRDKIIVIISTDGIINYSCISKAVFDKYKNIEIPKKGNRIIKGTATYKMHSDSKLLLGLGPLYQETDFQEWIECEKPVKAAEEVKKLGSYGKVLTVISKLP